MKLLLNCSFLYCGSVQYSRQYSTKYSRQYSTHKWASGGRASAQLGPVANVRSGLCHQAAAHTASVWVSENESDLHWEHLLAGVWA